MVVQKDLNFYQREGEILMKKIHHSGRLNQFKDWYRQKGWIQWLTEVLQHPQLTKLLRNSPRQNRRNSISQDLALIQRQLRLDLLAQVETIDDMSLKGDGKLSPLETDGSSKFWYSRPETTKTVTYNLSFIVMNLSIKNICAIVLKWAVFHVGFFFPMSIIPIMLDLF